MPSDRHGFVTLCGCICGSNYGALAEPWDRSTVLFQTGLLAHNLRLVGVRWCHAALGFDSATRAQTPTCQRKLGRALKQRKGCVCVGCPVRPNQFETHLLTCKVAREGVCLT